MTENRTERQPIFFSPPPDFSLRGAWKLRKNRSPLGQEEQLESFPRYLIERDPIAGKIGSTVYRGFDQVMGLDVAIKFVLHDFMGEFSDPQSTRQEAIAAAQDVPGLVGVYTYFETHQFNDPKRNPRGRDASALVMKYKDPKTNLQEILSNARRNRVFISYADIASCTHQLATTIDALAEKNLFHKDIKPANIFFGFGKMELCDFGISSIVDPHNTGTGTIYYLPYERILGSAFCGVRSEIWATALVVYEMLTNKNLYAATGLLPFIYDDHIINLIALLEQTDGLPSFAYNIFDELPKPRKPNQKTIQVLNTALRNRSEDRYASATEFAKELTDSLLVHA